MGTKAQMARGILVADEAWLGLALLHREHPGSGSFTPKEIFDRVKAEPRQWLAQEEVALSRAVCLRAGGGFEPRAVDLRPFVLLDERPWIVPGGLTRVAGDPEELVVNSSHGGGSKDTWVLTR